MPFIHQFQREIKVKKRRKTGANVVLLLRMSLDNV